MDLAAFTAPTNASPRRSSRRVFVLGLVGAALTLAIGADEGEARSTRKKPKRSKKRKPIRAPQRGKHKKKKKRGKKRKPNLVSPPPTPPP